MRRELVFFVSAPIAACLFPSLDPLTGGDGGAIDASSDPADEPSDASKVDVISDAGDAGAITVVQAAGHSYFGGALTVTVTSPSPETKGNLDVVSLSWQSDGYQSQITSVTDSDGNSYVAAVPANDGNVVGHAIYYAKNIQGGTQPNTVTVSSLLNAGSDGGADDVDIALVEVAGLDPSSPFETMNQSFGSGPTATSNNLVTTTAPSWLFAAAALEYGFGFPDGGGTSFTPIALAWGNRDVIGYQVLQTTGTYAATAPLAQSGNWIMQAAAFERKLSTSLRHQRS